MSENPSIQNAGRGIPSNSHTAITDLYNAGHYEQTIKLIDQLLTDAPEDPELHYFRGLAAIQLHRDPREIRQHFEFLLTNFPQSSRSHHLAALFHFARRDFRVAEKFINTAIEISPETSVYYRIAALSAAARAKFRLAQKHIAVALELDPHDTENVRISVELRGFSETAAKQAWEHISELEAALARNPNDPDLHASIGGIYLDQLDRPGDAELCFREALRLNPRDRNVQKLLFKAVARQRLIYRVLSIPSRCFEWLGHGLHGLRLQPWRGIFLLLGIKFFAVYFAWLFLATLVFWPPAKVYEWLLIEETRSGAATADWVLRQKRLLSRWPFAARFMLFIAISFCVWIIILSRFGFSSSDGALYLAGFVAIHFALTGISMIFKRVRTAWGKRRAKVF